MTKCEVISYFTLEKYKEVHDVERFSQTNRNQENEFFIGDTFYCDKDMVDYLTGNNKLNKIVVKIIEEESEKLDDWKPRIEEKLEEIEKPKKRRTKKK